MHNTSQAIKLFDRKFVANTLRNSRRCPKCRSEYSHYYAMAVTGDTRVKSNRPFLLVCGHNMCENCVYQHRQNLMCSICMRPIEISKKIVKQYSNFDVREFFDMNFYLLGELLHLKYYRRDAAANTTLQLASQNLSTASAELAREKCQECENAFAFGICRQCKVLYCEHCFNSIHMHTKVLKTHTLSISDNDRNHTNNKLSKLPKATSCRRHRRMNDRVCRKCHVICCCICVKTDHSSHGWVFLSNENENLKGEIVTFMETVQISRDCLKKAQKDVRSMEMQLEDYASQTLDKISNFFVQLHSFLQNEERRIIDDFNTKCALPQIKIRETYTQLNESQVVLNKMRSTLEYYQCKPPADIRVYEVLKVYSKQLEHLQCQVEVSKITKNPFVFETQQDLRDDFAKYYRCEYINPDISLRIGPIYGDLIRTFHDTLPQFSMDLDISLDSTATLSATDNHKRMNNEMNLQKKKADSGKTTEASSSNINSNVINDDLPSTSKAALAAAEHFQRQKKTATVLKPFKEKEKQAKDTISARISHVKSPENFYIQMESSMQQIRELSNKYVNFPHQDVVPKTITEGKCYMAYHIEDKQWYRAMVNKILAKDLYRIFLVDIGLALDVLKQRLCDIYDEKILSIPHAAIRCAIYDIMPADKTWSDEANNLLVEVTHNKSVKVSIIEQIKNSTLKVDIFTTHTPEPISVRDSFLYTGLALEKPGILNFKLQPKKMAPVARINQRFVKQTFQQGDILTVKVIHIEDPQEFYVIKLDQLEPKKAMFEELNRKYSEGTHENVYVATLFMSCAVCIDEVWHRASVNDIKDGGKVRVRLVDEGKIEMVHWRQIYSLENKFRKMKECATRCMLADIEPLQSNDYAWTGEAVKEFKQLALNPTLQLVICSARQGEYKVTLHICKKHLDINVGAVLAKYGHGLSTGESSQIAEIFKSSKSKFSLLNSALQELPIETSMPAHLAGNTSLRSDKTASSYAEMVPAGGTKILKRTPVKVVHIVNPGEFYLQLVHLISDINKFQQQIQEAQKLKSPCGTSVPNSPQFPLQEHQHSGNTVKEWLVGDHCLVYTKYKSWLTTSIDDYSASLPLDDQCEWYRGVIVAIGYETNNRMPFEIFLRDIGATIRSISSAQLTVIDHQWDRVTNAVHRCHLACVEPTGDRVSWSHSAIDCFKHSAVSFETLSATLQGKCAVGSSSLPIVLWGTTIETSDPLAPCISKHSNINRILVKAGLAHLVERLDITQQMDQLLKKELADGEISLEDWFKNFNTNNALKEIENALKTSPNANDDGSFELDDGDHSPPSDNDLSFELDDIEAHSPSTVTALTGPEAWLTSKPIAKSIFNAFPTYVDYDGVIYLHDAYDESLLAKIRSKIMKVYGETHLPNAEQIVYRIDQPCIAKYHLDSCYYRCIVKKLLNDQGEYSVQFIDYGNIETTKAKDMLPYAPLPNLHAIASKYRIEGIQPKNGEKKYSVHVLDIIHKIIVEKLVSIRVPTVELQKPVKLCSIRIGPLDLGHHLIGESYVDRVRRITASGYNYLQPLMEVNSDEDSYILPQSKNKENNPFLMQIERKNLHLQKKSTKAKELAEFSKDSDDYDDDDFCNDKVNARLDEILKGLDKYDADDVDVKEGKEDQHQLTFAPPRKKPMFDSHEYKRMHAQMQYGNIYGIDHFVTNDDEKLDCDGASAAGGINSSHIEGGGGALHIDDDDQDIVELEQSFALNYWHNIEEADEEEVQHTKLNNTKKRQDLESSAFEKFYPNETSSVFSHFSGIENFKHPQLPSGMHDFNCSVVFIITPTILQIYPHLTEFEYRDWELHRRIKQLVKAAPPLTTIEPRQMCLACYNKDKKWYRALIRSYNPVAKQADVFYVDYLNSESVPIKHLKECPPEVRDWPLRTFRVRLHGLTPSPRMREKDVRQALQNVLDKRTLYARINKDSNLCSNTDEVTTTHSGAGSNSSEVNLMEITLYENKDDTAPIYEALILENYYSHI